jgi:two-component system, OmpR family, sensor kinase
LSDYEKRSLFKFLSLYLGSAFIFILLISTLFYQLETTHSYELQKQRLKNFSAKVSAVIVDSHMKNEEYKLPVSNEFKIALLGKNGKILYSEIEEVIDTAAEFSVSKKGISVVDDSTRGHHGIYFVVAQESSYFDSRTNAFWHAFLLFFASFTLASLLAISLSREFLKPMRQEVQKIDGFIKASTHELNTPITTLILGLDAIAKECPNATKIAGLKASAKMISKIYDDLTYYLQKERPRREDEWLDFYELACQRVDFFGELASIKGVDISVNGVSFLYKIDRANAGRVLDNLISNAVKYSKPNGNVEVRIEPSKIIVKDNGIGIDEEKIDEIFGKYFRAVQTPGGFGLGLYIVKAICDDYNIKVNVKSEKNQGSEFELGFKE